MNGGTSIFSGKIGVLNLFPQSMLAPVIIFGKNTGGGSRNCFMGYTDTFFFCIGDFGNTNATNTLTQQFAILYSAPLSLVITAIGVFQMVVAGKESKERLIEVIQMLKNTNNP